MVPQLVAAQPVALVQLDGAADGRDIQAQVVGLKRFLFGVGKHLDAKIRGFQVKWENNLNIIQNNKIYFIYNSLFY